jgi:hypothetical protein
LGFSSRSASTLGRKSPQTPSHRCFVLVLILQELQFVLHGDCQRLFVLGSVPDVQFELELVHELLLVLVFVFGVGVRELLC